MSLESQRTGGQSFALLLGPRFQFCHLANEWLGATACQCYFPSLNLCQQWAAGTSFCCRRWKLQGDCKGHLPHSIIISGFATGSFLFLPSQPPGLLLLHLFDQDPDSRGLCCVRKVPLRVSQLWPFPIRCICPLAI